MKRLFLILAAAGMMVAEAPAARADLLEMLGIGARSSSRARQSSGARSRKPIRVESADEATNAVSNAAAATSTATPKAVVPAPSAPAPTTLLAIADESLPATNVVTKVETLTNTITQVETLTNTVTQTLTNTITQIKTLTNTVTQVETLTNTVTQVVTNTVMRGVIPKRESGPARISSNKAYYDRKEGYAVFTGNVHVDSEEYQMHAKKAYVFFEGTNELRRIVATGNVAITNLTKRAYGTKASYHRKNGMVVLYGDDKAAAEVRDESKAEDQVVRGSKIRFWTMSEQIEVLDAFISSPVEGDMKTIKSNVMPKK